MPLNELQQHPVAIQRVNRDTICRICGSIRPLHETAGDFIERHARCTPRAERTKALRVNLAESIAIPCKDCGIPMEITFELGENEEVRCIACAHLPEGFEKYGE